MSADAGRRCDNRTRGEREDAWQEVSCLFRGSAGSSTASSGTVRVNDRNWHVVRCERTSSSVTMTVDGVVTGRNRN